MVTKICQTPQFSVALSDKITQGETEIEAFYSGSCKYAAIGVAVVSLKDPIFSLPLPPPLQLFRFSLLAHTKSFQPLPLCACLYIHLECFAV